LTFDLVIYATDGCVIGVLMKPILSDNINGFANGSTSNERIYDINYLHIENDSVLFTKNVNQEFYAKHTKKFLEDSEVHSTG
jgi:hypothetical protein